ncbi:hypothetical protein [Photobacterium leiognathi]|uniref:Uncharacterized protein n=1 Tax=Photobacterium leiognathi TaxID=553611 RepID=A0A2T3M7I5_PHOLE|nr:hypothetical protein [Photobacterium leiognathi]KJF97427.1 hypothetical protein UB34_12975 [Photobacterium leiognathi]PSV88231.1 hypothetical protein CTM89_14725 [Photobacterium leiognathi]
MISTRRKGSRVDKAIDFAYKINRDRDPLINPDYVQNSPSTPTTMTDLMTFKIFAGVHFSAQNEDVKKSFRPLTVYQQYHSLV